MVSLKIECPCGQHYAFEVEPVMGRMPAPVACPACGEDGTLIANEMISRRTEPAQAPTILVSPLGPRATTAGPPSRHGAPLPGQPSRTQALFEARAKISWGDPPQEVLKYLMIQGFNYEEAGAAVKEMFDERAAAIRSRGIVYIVGGSGLICIPIVTWLIFVNTGIIYPRTLVITVAIGLGGIGVLIKGIFMFVAPRSSSGDVSEQ